MFFSINIAQDVYRTHTVFPSVASGVCKDWVSGPFPGIGYAILRLAQEHFVSDLTGALTLGKSHPCVENRMVKVIHLLCPD
jgi:hypothetical protein